MSGSVVIALAPINYADIEVFPRAEELASDICACADAGASVVHLHVTDAEGKPTRDTSFYERVIGRVREGADIIIQGSTGGVGLSPEERSVALRVPSLEMASLNMGSCNLFGKAYVNTPEDVTSWAAVMNEKKIVPDMCFFEPGFFTTYDQIESEGLVDPPHVASICLGFPGALPATVENLVFMVGKLPPKTVWTLVHHAHRDLALHAAAIACGGNIRVGFEDSLYLTSERKAASNRELVEKAHELVVHLGRSVASPEEARRRLGVQGKRGR